MIPKLPRGLCSTFWNISSRPPAFNSVPCSTGPSTVRVAHPLGQGRSRPLQLRPHQRPSCDLSRNVLSVSPAESRGFSGWLHCTATTQGSRKASGLAHLHPSDSRAPAQPCWLPASQAAPAVESWASPHPLCLPYPGRSCNTPLVLSEPGHKSERPCPSHHTHTLAHR